MECHTFIEILMEKGDLYEEETIYKSDDVDYHRDSVYFSDGIALE